MKNKFFLLMTFGLMLSLATFTSCSKENIDDTTIVEEEVTTVTEVVEEETVTCDGNITIISDSINIDEEGRAILFKGLNPGSGCTPDTWSSSDHNYIVYGVSYDIITTDVEFYTPADGIPGFGFGRIGLPEVGDELNPYLDYNTVIDPTLPTPEMWHLDFGTVITITEVGDEVGEFIGGTVSGTLTLTNFPDEDTIVEVTGSFCVPITEVCE